MVTPDQLLSALAAVRYYARHTRDCLWMCQCADCTCGLDDVLRGIDAMLAGRDVGNHPEAPESSTGKEPLQVRESDDGN